MVDTQNITRMGKKKKKDSGNMVRMMASVHFGLKMVRKEKKESIKTLKAMAYGPTGTLMAMRKGKDTEIMELKMGSGSIFMKMAGKKVRGIILTIINMDYGPFGIQMGINNLKVILKRTKKIHCGPIGMQTNKFVKKGIM